MGACICSARRGEQERSPAPQRRLVVHKGYGESDEEAMARAGERWPVIIAPEPCATTEEWLNMFHAHEKRT